MLPYHPYLGPVVALVAGLLILVQPALLSDGDKALWAMVVDRIILKRSSIGPLQIRPVHLFLLSPI